MPRVGSSSRTSAGEPASVAASAARCRSPELRSRGYRSAREASPNAASVVSADSTDPARRSVSSTSARTVGKCKSVPGFCGRYAVRPAGRSTVPASGGSSPASVRSSVVLPEPFGPVSATTSPAAPAREMPSRMAPPAAPAGPAATSRSSHDVPGPSKRWRGLAAAALRIASGVVRATRPPSTSSSRSAAGRSNSTRCSAITTACPASTSFRQATSTASVPSRSNCEVGSSRATS